MACQKNTDRPFTGPGFLRTLGCCLAKKHDGAQQFICLLFRPQRVLLKLLPVMGTLTALTPDSWHVRSLVKQDGSLLAYWILGLVSRFYPQEVSAKIRTLCLESV